MQVRFTKMQGLGNELILVQGPLKLSSSQIALYCDRRRGIGADGFIVVTPLSDTAVRMDYWNADGSTDTICGNGLRCVAKFSVLHHFVPAGEFVIETIVGDRRAQWDGHSEDISVQIHQTSSVEEPLALFGAEFYPIQLGNPHAVTFVKSYERAPVGELGPKVENAAEFPNKTNVEFVEIYSKSRIRMKVWERGVGQTKACGTGMTASAVAAHDIYQIQFPIEVETLGGTGIISLDEWAYYQLTGPAEEVSSGVLSDYGR